MTAGGILRRAAAASAAASTAATSSSSTAVGGDTPASGGVSAAKATPIKAMSDEQLGASGRGRNGGSHYQFYHWDIARGRTYSRLGRGPGGVTDLHAARPTPGPHHCREVPRKDDTTTQLPLSACGWRERFCERHEMAISSKKAVRCPAVSSACRRGALRRRGGGHAASTEVGGPAAGRCGWHGPGLPRGPADVPRQRVGSPVLGYYFWPSTQTVSCSSVSWHSKTVELSQRTTRS
jgi:hypothetical protein